MTSRLFSPLSLRLFGGACAVAFALPAFADSSCDVAYAAVIKSMQTPRHDYSIHTHSAEEMQNSAHFKQLTGKAMYASKTETSEAIIPAGEFEYAKLQGKWTRRASTAKTSLEMAQEKLDAHDDTCTLIGDQTADGQSVTVYQLHRKDDDDQADTQLRILKSSGLFEGQTTTWPGGSSIVTRYDYTSVQPPAGGN